MKFAIITAYCPISNNNSIFLFYKRHKFQVYQGKKLNLNKLLDKGFQALRDTWLVKFPHRRIIPGVLYIYTVYSVTDHTMNMVSYTFNHPISRPKYCVLQQHCSIRKGEKEKKNHLKSRLSAFFLCSFFFCIFFVFEYISRGYFYLMRPCISLSYEHYVLPERLFKTTFIQFFFFFSLTLLKTSHK